MHEEAGLLLILMLGEALKKCTVGTLLASIVALGMTLWVSQWV